MLQLITQKISWKSYLIGLVFFTGCGLALASSPLDKQIRTALPYDIKTIGAAMQYYLEPTEYRLVTLPPAPRESLTIFQRPLRALARLSRLRTIEESLLLVLDPQFELIIDHRHKLVSVGVYDPDKPRSNQLAAKPEAVRKTVPVKQDQDDWSLVDDD